MSLQSILITLGQQFQNAGSRFDATIQLIHGVGPPGVDGNGRNNFFMPFSQFEHDLVGNVKFRFFWQGSAVVGMGNVLSEQNEGIDLIPELVSITGRCKFHPSRHAWRKVRFRILSTSYGPAGGPTRFSA